LGWPFGGAEGRRFGGQNGCFCCRRVSFRGSSPTALSPAAWSPRPGLPRRRLRLRRLRLRRLRLHHSMVWGWFE
ncbi:unnamed protein product, partial [Gadus morhua 'NCC']